MRELVEFLDRKTLINDGVEYIISAPKHNMELIVHDFLIVRERHKVSKYIMEIPTFIKILNDNKEANRELFEKIYNDYVECMI